MLQKHNEKLESIREELASLCDDNVEALVAIKKGLDLGDNSEFELVKDILNKSSKKGKKLDNDILVSLALFGAEASDLRGLVAYLKTVNELIRMSDNIKSFSKRITKQIQEQEVVEINKKYSDQLFATTLESAKLISLMLHSKDEQEIMKLHKKVSILESKNDDFFNLLEKDVIMQLSNASEFSALDMDILSIMRKLERIADRAVDISKLLVFVYTGGKLDVY